MDLSYEEKQKMVNDILTLEEHQQTQIFYIIHNNKLKYSHNKNGLLMELNECNNDVLNEIYTYVQRCLKDNEYRKIL